MQNDKLKELLKMAKLKMEISSSTIKISHKVKIPFSILEITIVSVMSLVFCVGFSFFGPATHELELKILTVLSLLFLIPAGKSLLFIFTDLLLINSKEIVYRKNLMKKKNLHKGEIKIRISDSSRSFGSRGNGRYIIIELYIRVNKSNITVFKFEVEEKNKVAAMDLARNIIWMANERIVLTPLNDPENRYRLFEDGFEK